MTAELQKHWEAEDDLLNMQTVLDETDLKLLDAKCEIQRLNKKISDESQNEKHMEEQFEAISGTFLKMCWLKFVKTKLDFIIGPLRLPSLEQGKAKQSKYKYKQTYYLNTAFSG